MSIQKLEFDTLEQAELAVQRIDSIGRRYWQENGGEVSDGSLVASGGITTTWAVPKPTSFSYDEDNNLVVEPNTTYYIEDFRSDERYNHLTLLDYKLGVPVNEQGEPTGNMVHVYPDSILSYDSEFFTVNTDGELVFTVPDSGATTPNSSKIRTELRHMTDYAYTEPSEHTVEFSVEQCGDGNGVIVHQIHGDKETFYIAKVYCREDGNHYLRIFVDVSEDDSDKHRFTALSNISYGDRIKLRAVYAIDTFHLFVNDEHTLTVNDIQPRVENQYYYWKAGAYWDKNDGEGSTCIVKHYPV